MESNFKERLEALKQKMKEPAAAKSHTWRKRLAAIGISAAALGLLGSWYAAKDYFLKRQNYPERNVLFRSSSVGYISAGSSLGGVGGDYELVTKVYEGGTESKVGTFLFQSTREVRKDIEYFNLDNSSHIMVASATRKPEKVQPGLRMRGAMIFKEQFAEITDPITGKSKQKYTTYKFVPERGLNEKEVSIVDLGGGKREMENVLTERRSIVLGWKYGKEFRGGTFLEEYIHNSEFEAMQRSFIDALGGLDTKLKSASEREKTLDELIGISDSMAKIPIYYSYEDGIIDLLPQESTIYLGYNPSYLERVKHDLGFGRHEHPRLRVENYWDLWPGNYWLLNKLTVGSGEDAVRPFGKCNNGGYVLEDKYGAIAQIDIKDFFFRYGNDVIYTYSLDLNGDGKIGGDEVIGTVLCRLTNEGDSNLREIRQGRQAENDVTLTTNYSFMAPSTDLKKGLEYFNLCANIESCIPDQVHRGFGKHSLLGLINEQRSDILLYRDMNIRNLSRALTQESTLAAKYDIVRVLIAAGRDYAQDVAKSYGVDEEFTGRYQVSPLLHERFEPGPLPGIFLVLGGIGAGVYLWKRHRKQSAGKLVLDKK